MTCRSTLVMRIQADMRRWRIQAFAEALAPKALVPIHTEYGALLQEHFKNVAVFEDVTKYKIGGRDVE